MNKKDRIAVVVSVLIFALNLPDLLRESGLGILILFIILGYWSIRFIKNDISFIRFKS